MKNFEKTLKHGVLFLLLILNSQLSAFTLSVSAVNETCLGNGSLTFDATDTLPGATISYSVYLLPNTTTPIAVLTTNTLTGLNAGNYRIVATQSVGGNSTVEQQDITILNEVVPLSFSIQDVKERCGYDGVLTVSITSGSAVSYQIISGPVTTPVQDSNVFTGLTAGQYQVRVHDNCGDAVVQTYTLLADNVSLNISPAYIDSENLECDTIIVINPIGTLPSYVIAYPLQVTHEVFPPGGGASIILTQTVESGLQVQAEIPFYHAEQYNFVLTITDACGNVYVRNNTILEHIRFSAAPMIASCDGMLIRVSPDFFVPPYTLEFLQAPEGFNPLNYNLLHPGPFTGNIVNYGGQPNPVPEGNYIIRVTDACGRTATDEIEVKLEEAQPPFATTVADDCGNIIAISINSVNPAHLVSVILTEAPETYPNELPEDLSYLILDDSFEMPVYWQGDYVFEVIDSCERDHILSVTISDVNTMLSVSQRPGCDFGFGGIRIGNSNDVDFTSVTLIAAPESFTGTLPLDLTNNISGTIFSFGAVPQGIYTFIIVDECGTERVEKIEIEGYEVYFTEKTIFENCGSFDMILQHSSNGNFALAFWLQKYYEESGAWGHPVTGEIYQEGTLPNNVNSKNLELNNINLNIASTGNFRILKRFQTYNQNGNLVNCIHTLDTFIFNGGPQITNVLAFSCTGGNVEVVVEAIGLDPLQYKITHKNGQPFVIENGQLNYFSNLEPAIYNFEVSDICGNIVNSLFDVNALPSVSVSISDLCEGHNGHLSLPYYSFLNYQWWKADDPSNILSATNILEFEPFDYEIHGGTYVVSVVSQNQNSCVNQEITVEIGEGLASPNAGEDATTILCSGNDSVDLFSVFTSEYDDFGSWEDLSDTGFLTGSVLNTAILPAGIYEFQYTVTGFCDMISQSVITVQIIDIPDAPQLSYDTVCEGETLQINATSVLGFQYHWSGPNGFTSNEQNIVIENVSLAHAGTYSLYVSQSDCISEVVSIQVNINELPRFEINGDEWVCDGQFGELFVTAENFNISEATFVWYFNDEVIANASDSVLEVSEPGVYEVAVTVNSCSFSQEFVVIEGISEIEPILVSECTLERFVLFVANADAFHNVTFVWEGPNGFSATGSLVDITNGAIGTYIVTVIPEEGCATTGEIEVVRTRCAIPKGLSPNGDFLNDGFDLSGFDALKVKIFNRYGMLMYEQDNYVNEWKGQCKNGNILPSATYYYLVTFRDGSQKTGWVYLQRENN